MKKIVKCFLHYSAGKHSKGYEVWPHNMVGSDDLFFISAKEVEFDIPDDFGPRPAQIKALEQKQKEAAAAFQAFTTETRRQIQELQALEMTV